MISVCMATYNGAKYLRQQLESILYQLDDEDEIIISDDSSNDNTIAILESYNDDRIHICKSNFHSPIYNFENALKQAKGDLIFLSDQDDIWANNRVEKIKLLLDQYDLVVSNAEYIDACGSLSGKYYFEKKPNLGIISSLFRNYFFGASMAFRRDVLDYSLPFPKRISMHDQWIGLMACLKGAKIGFTLEPLLLYRRHDTNASFNVKSHNPYKKRIMFRLNMLYSLFLRVLKLG